MTVNVTVDTHVRRSGEDYGTAFLTLLPQGQAWPKYPGTTLDLACRGLAEYWGFVDSRAADLLERESDPRYHVRGIAAGLGSVTGVCRSLLHGTADHKAERQQALVMRMTMQGAQSRRGSTSSMSRPQIGYTISITENIGRSRRRHRPRLVIVASMVTAKTLILNEWKQAHC